MRAPLPPSLLLTSILVAAQTPSDLDSEPHYHLLLENSSVRVFRMTVHPDESAYVRFRHSFITVALQDGEIIVWDEGKSPIQHFQVRTGEARFQCLSAFCVVPEQLAKGLSGGYRNDRQKDYRNITVEFLDPNIGWDATQGAGLTGDRGSTFLGGAIMADVQLQPGESLPAPEKRGAELIIPLSDLDLKGTDGVRIRNSMGEVAWIPADATSVLVNHGRTPAWFVVVEFHPDTPFAPLAPRRAG
jgi:hypothetical protein